MKIKNKLSLLYLALIALVLLILVGSLSACGNDNQDYIPHVQEPAEYIPAPPVADEVIPAETAHSIIGTWEHRGFDWWGEEEMFIIYEFKADGTLAVFDDLMSNRELVYEYGLYLDGDTYKIDGNNLIVIPDGATVTADGTVISRGIEVPPFPFEIRGETLTIYWSNDIVQEFNRIPDIFVN